MTIEMLSPSLILLPDKKAARSVVQIKNQFMNLRRYITTGQLQRLDEIHSLAVRRLYSIPDDIVTEGTVPTITDKLSDYGGFLPGNVLTQMAERVITRFWPALLLKKFRNELAGTDREFIESIRMNRLFGVFGRGTKMTLSQFIRLSRLIKSHYEETPSWIAL